ncbi:MAG TPA: HAMP domain-containing sensor histidine kinase [Terriglobales bacterium]|nr:HAMP domain-containing sensor histidine kinase [Terriglobales bacterium]
MRIASRAKTTAFFITLGAFLVGFAIALNVSWIKLTTEFLGNRPVTWREVVPAVLGVIFFLFIIAGLVLNTTFLIREIRRNEQQDSFLNAVTHELKTPITSIRLYLETLQRRQVDEDQRHDFYRIMLEDTQRLLGTVEQVLQAGEARHGKARKNWQELNLSAIVKDAVELAQLRHNLPPGSLCFGPASSEGVLVMGNQEELRTAIGNLFDNAIKYSGATKDIHVELLTPDIDTVLLRVSDKGIGIPGDELKRIFKRFYRVQNASAGQVKGTGLGLFIVRSIARRHGGDAFAESEGEGRGSTFTLRLPRVYHV